MECFIQGTRRGLWELSFGEILYADDTGLVVDTEEQAQSILETLERVARTYGLNKNKKGASVKCWRSVGGGTSRLRHRRDTFAARRTGHISDAEFTQLGT